MRRQGIIATALALGLLALTAPSAPAADQSWSRGDCGFDTVQAPSLTGDTWTGIGYADVVVYSSTHGNVVNATVTCELRVNGVTQMTVSGSGTSVVVFATPMSFHAAVTDVVSFCTVVDYTSDTTPTTVDCGAAVETQVIPQWTVDLIDWVIDVANYAIVSEVDPRVCAAFQAFAPGSDPVTITPEGDVYIAGEFFWDCPPYENPVGGPPSPNPPLPDPAEHGPTGGGWNDGDTGFLTLVSPETTVLLPPADPIETRDVASTCAFHTDRDAGTITVTGTTATGRTLVADTTSIHCQLQDAETGAVVYDHTESAAGPIVSWRDTVPAIAGKVTVCTEGTGVWGTRTVTVGQYCRPGLPI